MKSIFCRFTAPKSQADSAANVNYITRETALGEHEQALYLHNLSECRGEDLRETRINLDAFAKTRLIEEKHTSRTGAGQTRTHYRCVVSFDRKESTEKAQQLTQEFLQKYFPQTRAISAIHQDTNHTHAHIWIDARQLNGKKIDLDNKTFERIDTAWAKVYAKEYGQEYAKNHAEKKLETRNYKRASAHGIEAAKPERQQKKIDYRQRDYNNYGIDKEGIRGNQPDLAITNPALDQAEQPPTRTEREFRETVSSVTELHRSFEGLGRGRQNELQPNQELDTDRGRERERVRELEK
jgi:hypothetical protein